MKVKFSYKHYRIKNQGDLPTSGKPPLHLLFPTGGKKYHPEELSLNGGATQCFIDIYDDNEMKMSTVIGYAFCSMSDKFCKATGRKIALNRAVTILTD